MQKYNWSIETLVTRAEDLEKMYKFEMRKKDKDPALLEKIKTDYNTLANEVFELRNCETYDAPTILETYRYLRQMYEESEFLWPELKFWTEVTKNKPILVPELKRNSFSKEDLLTLTHDFYRDLGNSFYGNFMKCFYRRKDHVRFIRNNFQEKYEGSTINLHTFNESFITVQRNNTIKDFTTLVHEYAHALLFQMNPNQSDDLNNIFNEILPILFENMALDYYLKVTKDPNALKEKVNYYNGNIIRSDFVNNIIRIIQEERKGEKPFSCNKELKEAAFKTCGLTCQELNGLLEHPLSIADTTLANYLLSIELYYLSLGDKEKFLNTIKKIAFLEGKTKEDYYHQILKLGIIPNLHSKEFESDLQTQALTLRKTKK